MNTKQENENILAPEKNLNSEQFNAQMEDVVSDQSSEKNKSLVNEDIVFKTQKKLAKMIVNIFFGVYIILLLQEFNFLLPQEFNFLSGIRKLFPLCNVIDVIWAKYICLCLTIIALVLLFLNQRKKIKWHWFFIVFVCIIGFVFSVPEHKNDSIFNDDRTSGDFKPIIYLYPTEQTEVTVKLGNPQKLTHTYPKYKDKWQVIAQPNGDLTDIQTKRSLYALYWEGVNNDNNETTTGFIVKGEDTISFLEEKLAVLGLNEREANEFIIYWLPILESSPYNLIYFKTIAEQDKNMPLYISPKPDTVIRVMMAFKNLNEPIEVEEQVLPQTPQRNGFTVVEWGGTDLTGNIVR